MAYQIVYDAERDGMRGTLLVGVGLAFCGIGVLAAGLPEAQIRGPELFGMGKAESFALIWLCVCGLWTAIVSWSLAETKRSLVAAVRGGTCAMAEGLIQSATPGLSKFSVGATTFTREHNNLTGAFRRLGRFADPKRSRVEARIHYLPRLRGQTDDGDTKNAPKNVIARLEARALDPAPLSPAAAIVQGPPRLFDFSRRRRR